MAIFTRDLAQRIFGALLLLPPVLAALWFSGVWYDALLLVGGVLMVLEWCNLTDQRKLAVKAAMTLAVIVPLYLVQHKANWLAHEALVPLLAIAAVSILIGRATSMKSLMWLGLGFSYCLAPLLALEWLRDQPGNETGLAVVLWCFLLVWGTDIGGYFVGKNVGGPKLAPTLSPNKTWSGLIGGMVLAAGLAMLVWLMFDHLWTPWMVALSAFVMGFVAQMGDLFESGIKRHFGVKDSGSIIPGHGGILDRIDGLVFVAVITALLMSLTGFRP